MFCCNEVVTLVQMHGDLYECTCIVGASWYGRAAVTPLESGTKPTNTYKSRIPAKLLPESVTPREGDYLVRGVLAAMERAADLRGREYMTVTAVGDNRRGRFPHWAVSGA